MSELHNAIQEYLSLRRALGYKLKEDGSLLDKFALFADSEGALFITTDLALRWAIQPTNAHPSHWANRLRIVRIFAEYRSAEDPRTEIPPQGLLPHRYQRKTPYIYTDAEIRLLVETAKQLQPPMPLRSHTYSTLFGLLAVTGMRLTESLHLNREDIDLIHGVITVRQAKFGKSRLIPIHLSTQKVLAQYERLRDRLYPKPLVPAFFISDQGTRLNACTVRQTFVKVSCQIGLRKPAKSHGHGPRLHDLRHAFVVRTIINWYRQGVEVERELPKLSTYLGHVHVSDTYWYLTAIPELMQLVSTRLEFSKEHRHGQ